MTQTTGDRNRGATDTITGDHGIGTLERDAGTVQAHHAHAATGATATEQTTPGVIG